MQKPMGLKRWHELEAQRGEASPKVVDRMLKGLREKELAQGVEVKPQPLPTWSPEALAAFRALGEEPPV